MSLVYIAFNDRKFRTDPRTAVSGSDEAEVAVLPQYLPGGARLEAEPSGRDGLGVANAVYAANPYRLSAYGLPCETTNVHHQPRPNLDQRWCNNDLTRKILASSPNHRHSEAIEARMKAEHLGAGKSLRRCLVAIGRLSA